MKLSEQCKTCKNNWDGHCVMGNDRWKAKMIDMEVKCEEYEEMVESCWLIEFKDGHKVIVSEELYEQEVKRSWAGKPRLVEAHWFDFRKCRERNRDVLCAGFQTRRSSMMAMAGWRKRKTRTMIECDVCKTLICWNKMNGAKFDEYWQKGTGKRLCPDCYFKEAKRDG